MKKFLLLLLIGLISLEVDAQLMFNNQLKSDYLPGLSANDDFTNMLKKKKKKRKSSRGKSKRKGSRSSSGGGLGVGGGLFLGMPMGDFADAVKTGMGVNIDAEYFVMPEISVGLNTGYYSFKYKPDLFGTGSFNIVPFMVKGHYYFMEDAVRPYAGLAVGIFNHTQKYEFTWPSIFLNPVTNEMDTVMLKTKVTDKKTELALAPTVGVLFSVSDNISLNINAKYEMFWLKDEAADKTESMSFLGFNVGLVYMIGL